MASLIDAGRVAALLEADKYAKANDVRLIEVGADTITLGLTITGEITNFHGAMHGGALFSLADSALSLASNAHGGRAPLLSTPTWSLVPPFARGPN